MKTQIGIGYRKDFAEEFMQDTILKPDFVEVAPENWMRIGGYWKKVFREVADKYPVFLHGLSLSIGSPDELDMEFLGNVKKFIKEYDIKIYSEHLSFNSCDNAHLYNLLPIPFREDAIKHVSARIRQVQDFLEMPLAIENVSYYTPVAAEMSEQDFINAIIAESGCNMLLDVNNVYVNAFNHNYDAKKFIKDLPLEKVAYFHMAGHTQVEPDLIIDTHGENIIDPVYELFDYTTQLVQPVPVLLERDFNIPEFEQLQSEIENLRSIANKNLNKSNVTTKEHIQAAV